MTSKQKIVGMHPDTYEQLRGLKYELKVDSFDEALRVLLNEHSKKGDESS